MHRKRSVQLVRLGRFHDRGFGQLSGHTRFVRQEDTREFGGDGVRHPARRENARRHSERRRVVVGKGGRSQQDALRQIHVLQDVIALHDRGSEVDRKDLRRALSGIPDAGQRASHGFSAGSTDDKDRLHLLVPDRFRNVARAQRDDRGRSRQSVLGPNRLEECCITGRGADDSDRCTMQGPDGVDLGTVRKHEECRVVPQDGNRQPDGIAGIAARNGDIGLSRLERAECLGVIGERHRADANARMIKIDDMDQRGRELCAETAGRPRRDAQHHHAVKNMIQVAATGGQQGKDDQGNGPKSFTGHSNHPPLTGPCGDAVLSLRDCPSFYFGSVAASPCGPTIGGGQDARMCLGDMRANELTPSSSKGRPLCKTSRTAG